MKEEITIEEIVRLSELSKLSFSEEEKYILKGEIEGIIDLLNQCDNVRVDVASDVNVQKLRNLREDEVEESMELEDVFSTTEHAHNGYFVVPKVVD